MRHRDCLWFAAGLAVGIIAAGHLCRAQESAPDRPQAHAAASESPQAVLQRAWELNTERATVLAELVRLLSAETQAEVLSKQQEQALLLIGDLHMSTPSVVATLLRHLYIPRDSPPGPIFGVPPLWDEFPAFGALAEVGLPAIPPLVDEIRTAEDPMKRGHAPLFLSSLLGAHGRLWLSDALSRERNEEVKARLEEALKRGGFTGVGAYGRYTWFFKRLDQAEPWYYQPPDA